MKVRWTEGAAQDLTEIVAYIKRGSPESARRVASNIYDLSMSLADFPYKGHRRKSDGSYELVCYPWSYVMIYEVIGDGIFIHGVYYTSRDRRP